MVWTVRPARTAARPPWPCSKPTKAPHPNPLPLRRRCPHHPFASQSAVCGARTAVVRSSASGIFCHPEKSLRECSHLLICGDGPLAKRPVQFGLGRCTYSLCPRWLPKSTQGLGYPPANLRCPTHPVRSRWSTNTAPTHITAPVSIKLQIANRGSDLVQRGFCCGSIPSNHCWA